MSREIKKSVTLKQLAQQQSNAMGYRHKVVQTVNITDPDIGSYLSREQVNTLINQGVKVTIK